MHGSLNVKTEEWNPRFQRNSGHHPCVSIWGAIAHSTILRYIKNIFLSSWFRAS